MNAVVHTPNSDAPDTAGAPPTQKQDGPEEALVGAALACVRWDESVDLNRLMALEFKHNFGLFTSWLAQLSPIARHIVKLECLTRRPFGESVDLTPHDDGTWSLDNGERMTDAQLAGMLAVCARHTKFWLMMTLKETALFAQTWLPCVVDGLARQQRAWTGIEIMRTRNLCVALAALVDARTECGPFGRVDVPKSGPFDQGAVPPACADAGDDVAICSVAMREAMTRVHVLLQTRLAFRGRSVGLWDPVNTVYTFDFTRRLLAAVQSAVERLYATEPVYIKMIAPAEYEVMVAEAPLGATFFRP
ncbi:hypothetical protein pqer_cds_1009 [Pandoravirus quercus]|uniref:Uncharacterized protein n=1 Tax=Pandoravirus quercus TaxID=2107709 RepID=A0A2U7UAG0_9VIRU|nr:hypothetical protein pqer_cds_1009 [Pandoravirus quercus]AVK75431.1 hypothetical protein pqer_cds_1009 [Pandoravirus quercus]